MKNKMKAVARKEFVEMIPLCARCDAEMDDYESCYCTECEAAIEADV
jgi:predicted amidophosphoribosyltransferase